MFELVMKQFALNQLRSLGHCSAVLASILKSTLSLVRVGSEFWSQPQQIGESIVMTLNQSEQGNPPDIEHIGRPFSSDQVTRALVTEHYECALLLISKS